MEVESNENNNSSSDMNYRMRRALIAQSLLFWLPNAELAENSDDYHPCSEYHTSQKPEGSVKVANGS